MTTTIFHSIEAALDERGYSFHTNPASGSTVFFLGTTEDDWWRSQFLHYEDSRFVELNVFCTDELHLQTKNAWVCELAMRMTDAMPLGTFIFRHDDQDVRYRTVRKFGSETITHEAVGEMLENSAFPLKVWQRAYAFRTNISVSPADAVALALYELSALREGLPSSAVKHLLRMTKNHSPTWTNSAATTRLQLSLLKSVEPSLQSRGAEREMGSADRKTAFLVSS